MTDLLDATAEPGTALVIIPAEKLPTLLAADKTDIFGRLLKELEGWEANATTPKRRAEIGSKVQKARVARADFERLADSLKEDAIKTQRTVNAEFKVLDERMESLIKQIDAPRAAYKAAEEARVKANQDAIAAMEALAVGLDTLAPDEIHLRSASIQPFEWSVEFRDRAEKVRAGVVAQLKVAYGEAIQGEANAEAERVRLAEEAEAARLAGIEAQRVREEQIVREAVAEATRLAQEKSAQEAEEARQAAQAALLAEQEAAAERERLAKEELARVEAERLAGIERERVAAEKAEADRIATHKRALESISGMIADACSPFNDSNMIRHITSVMGKMSEITRDFEEFAEEAETLIVTGRENIAERLKTVEAEEAELRETRRIAAHEHALGDFTFLLSSVAGNPSSADVAQSINSLQRLHANRDWQEFSDRAAKERADTMATFQMKLTSALAREKKGADELAETRRQQIVKDEQDRVAREAETQRLIDEKRAANTENQRRVNREIIADLMERVTHQLGVPFSEANAVAVMMALAKGEIRNCRVEY